MTHHQTRCDHKIKESLQLLASFHPSYNIFQQIWPEPLGQETMADHLWRKYQGHPEMSNFFNRLDMGNQISLLYYLMKTANVHLDVWKTREIIYLFTTTVWCYLNYPECQNILPQHPRESWKLSQESPHSWFLSLTESDQKKVLVWFLTHNPNG